MFLLFKNTHKGYRYSIFFITSMSLIVSFILGIGLAKVLAYKGDIINDFERDRIDRWTNPESGRLSGEVIYIDNDYILLRDIKNDVWNVYINYVPENSRQTLDNNTLISIIGRYDGDLNFTACQIMPLDLGNFWHGEILRKDRLL